jgi:fimbrial chaperone protein
VAILNNSTFNPDLTAMNRLWAIASFVALFILVVIMPGLARAANWEIDPVRVELSAKQTSAAVIIRNNSNQPTTIQLNALSWTQSGGKDVYEPTRELIVSPPIATIAAKGEQVIRVALRGKIDGANELTYRINLQELPPHSKPGFTGLQVALHISLPVFVKPQKGKALPRGGWVIAQMPDDSLKVVMQNQGNEHLQISDFALYVPGSVQALAQESGSSYVLAGQVREWLLKTNSPEKIIGGRLQLKANTDAGNVDTELALGKP